MLTKFPGDIEEWINRAGTHSTADISTYSDDEKLVFALLEAVDFECWEYNDAPSTPTEETAKEFLIINKDVIGAMKIEPPSYLGALAGKFDFLKPENQQAD